MRRCFTCQARFEDQRLVCPSDGDVLGYEGKPCADTGRVLAGRYRLGNLLGEGGMGRVLEAVRLDTGLVLAMKLLRSELTAAKDRHDAAEKRFEVEARAASALEHPGIVKVFEFSASSDGESFIAMERLYGSTFDELRRAGKFGALERVMDLMRQVCEVLAAAHSKGIVHRDLKPSNLFLHRLDRSASQVKVLDFGIAKILDAGGERITSTGEFLGTLLYMAPELAGGHPVTPGADVYSLGVLLFEALAGKVPFTGRTPMELIRLHASAPAPALSTYRPEVSEELEDLVARCLLKKPEGRPADAGALAAAIAGLRALRAPAGGSVETRTLRANPSSWVGTVIDERYEIHEWISPGRFGSDVYRATHLRTGASVAVRLWRTGKGAVRDCLLDAFRREAKAMGVRHPNLIAILDLGFNDDCVYIVTEIVESTSLRTLIARKGAIPRPQARELIRGAADALRALHEKGIVSGGLSPETVRVVEGASGPERLLISPFGVTNLKQVHSLLPRAERTGMGDRSADYISPEQRLGREPDARSDLYSLGLILLEMLGGLVPEQGLPPTRSVAAGVEAAGGAAPGGAAPGDAREPAEPAPRLPSGLEPGWRSFLERAVARSPDGRFASADDFLAALPPV
ncbi:MAG: serine/threonine protein kinase [Planctomycetes bacterium]|nr:serine/threonine protein kinase [Planctomycetota bacterium]